MEEGIVEHILIDADDPSDTTPKPTGVTSNWLGARPKSILKFIPRNVDEPAGGGNGAFG